MTDAEKAVIAAALRWLRLFRDVVRVKREAIKSSHIAELWDAAVDLERERAAYSRNG